MRLTSNVINLNKVGKFAELTIDMEETAYKAFTGIRAIDHSIFEKHLEDRASMTREQAKKQRKIMLKKGRVASMIGTAAFIGFFILCIVTATYTCVPADSFCTEKILITCGMVLVGLIWIVFVLRARYFMIREGILQFGHRMGL